MATKKDLVEAHAFSRRRLVTAFVSGAPGGREVEPARPGRVIVGGLALAVLLVAGAAIAGIFAGKTPEDWAQPGLFISKEWGTAYVVTEEADPAVLRPVINITSAKLIIGQDMDPEVIAQSAIDQEKIGEDIGILGAPAAPPSPGQLINTGWTACTDTGRGVRLDIARDPRVTPTPSAGAVVKAGRRFYLLARASPTLAETPGTYAYELPGDAGSRDNLLAALGLRPSTYATEVSDRFLALLPVGGDLGFQSMGITGAGRPASYVGGSSGIPAEGRVGDIVVLPDGAAVVLTVDGPADLSPFALAVYTNRRGGFVPQLLQVSTRLGSGRVQAPYAAANWPDGRLAPATGERCLQLSARAGQPPQVALIADPAEAASSTAVESGQVSVRVEPGLGAYVLSGAWGDTARGTPFLMDSTGKSFELEGDETATLLGFGDLKEPVVPDTWVELFEHGVPLSQDVALCPPRPDDKKSAPCG